MRPAMLIAGILAIIALASGLFLLKNAVEERRERLTALQAQIREDRQAMAVLLAEWTHLTAPDRIQTLSDRHLSLRPLTSGQIIDSPTQIPPHPRSLLASAPHTDSTAHAPRKSVTPAPRRDFAARMRAAIDAEEGTQ